MFDTFNDGPRTWKWAVPGFFCLTLGFFGLRFAAAEGSAWGKDGGVFMVIVATLCGAVCLANLWRWLTAISEENFHEHQASLSLTPTVLLAQAMKSMHPEAVRVLERFGVRTSWQVRVDANKGTRTWVLENTDPNVHFGFIEFVLSRSGRALYPKNRFSEGSKKWDPDGRVLDREQYEEFEKWLFTRLMVTRSHGEFKPAEFIPPWNPQTIMEIMGLTGEQALYEPADVMKELVDAPKGNGNGARADAEKAQKEADVPALKDEEWEALQRVEAEEGKKYRDGVVPR